MASYRVVSSDNHIFEPADLWTTRIEPEYRDRCPKVVREESGGDTWYCDGIRGNFAGSGSQPGRRFSEPEKLSTTDTMEDVLPGGYIPEEHVKDMDADGIDVSIVYPTAGLILYRVPDSRLFTAVCRAYNDWIAEFCNPYHKRLKGIAMLNVDDVEVGVKELERCAKMGLAGGMISVYPLPGKSYNVPEYEPLWDAAVDLGMPLSLHVQTNRPGPQFDIETTSRPSYGCNTDHWARVSLADMIFGGVFERHPTLKVGSVEVEMSWVPYFLDRMNFAYTQRVTRGNWYRFKEDMLPGDYFHRNVFLGFLEDSLGVRDRHIIGVDNLLWGSDYPHPESTFPRSREIIEEILAGCTEEEKAKIAGGNAARVYHLN